MTATESFASYASISRGKTDVYDQSRLVILNLKAVSDHNNRHE